MSITKAQLIEENERLRAALTEALEQPGPTTRSFSDSTAKPCGRPLTTARFQ